MKFKYSGPISGITLNVGDSKKPEYKDFIFMQGQEYDLPENNKYVKTLIARDHLKPIENKRQSVKNKKEVENAG